MSSYKWLLHVEGDQFLETYEEGCCYCTCRLEDKNAGGPITCDTVPELIDAIEKVGSITDLARGLRCTFPNAKPSFVRIDMNSKKRHIIKDDPSLTSLPIYYKNHVETMLNALKTDNHDVMRLAAQTLIRDIETLYTQVESLVNSNKSQAAILADTARRAVRAEEKLKKGISTNG